MTDRRRRYWRRSSAHRLHHINKGKARRYRRAVDVAATPLAFWFALRFNSYFLALIRCLRNATLFVLFMPGFLSYPFYRTGTLFFALHTAFKFDLGQFFGFVTAVKVFIVVGNVVIIVSVITQHAVFGVSANDFTTALRREAHLAEHVRMLVLFADHQAHLPIFHRQDSRRVTVAALHEINNAIRQARFYLPD